jgi:hypothetical protein
MRLSADAWSRRRALFGGSCLVLASVLPLSRLQASEACVDPDELSDGEQSMRQSLAYTDAAADSNKVCNGCSYFSASERAGCGQCLIMQGTVSAAGHCDSWTAKSKGER